MSTSRTDTPATNAITIDASGRYPEQGDGILNCYAQALLKLIALRLMPTNQPLPSDLGDRERKTVEVMAKRIGELHTEHDECLRALSVNGWFLSPDTPVARLRVLRQSLVGASVAFSTSEIRAYFLERLDALERTLLEAYPPRGHILRDAFRAHHAGEYTLSVPVFLCQADGIWRDGFGKNFFLPKHREATLERSLEDVQLRYVASMLHILKTQTAPLWASESERDSSFDALNRHQVLHGEAVDYATEENSLKAISLMDCFRGLSRRVAQ